MAFLALSMTMSAAKNPVIERIDPTDWFVDMKNPSLQLMVYGQDIGAVDRVTTDYPGVVVDSLVHLDSPNYLLVYLNLSGAKPGTMTLSLEKRRENGKKAIKVQYELKQREMSGAERRGFDIGDVLYMLMPDRFAQGAGHPTAAVMTKGKHRQIRNAYREDRTQPSLRHGGDLEGIRQHLDYFCDLGVTALWLTPVLENDSPDDERGFSTYHGYATTDYYRVDPRFGTNADYRRLCDEAHARGLKVVMDMIFNHCGFDHPWVADHPSKDWFNLSDWLKQSNGSSNPEGTDFLQTSYKLTPVMDPYASEVDLKETVEGWFVPTMPDLNQRNPHLMRYLIQNSFWWIETVGIDGIRMDTYPYAYADAMAQWMRELNDEYPNFNTVGETWVTEPAYTAAWQDNPSVRGLGGSEARGPEESESGEAILAPPHPRTPATPATPIGRSYLKTVMDFSFYDKINQAKGEETDAWWQGLNRLYNSFVYDYLYPNPSSVMAFIDNHDTDRFLGEGHDTLMLKQALALLLTVRRIPQLYYGTEIMMNGTKAVTDGNVRKDFPGGFPGDSRDAFTREGRTQAQQQMFQWLSRLLHWRQGNPVISRGTMKQFIPYKGIYVIARQLDGKTVMTVLNGTTKAATLEVNRYREVVGSAARVKDILTGRYYDLSHDLELRPRQSLILQF